ncbi:MAG: magnesium transporter [Bacteroidales bacterium]
MSNVVSKELIEKVRELLESHDDNLLLETIEDMHAADIAEIMEHISIDEAKEIYLLLDGEKGADVLLEIPEDELKRFLKVLPPEVIANQFINNMDSDDATDVIGLLNDDDKQQVLGSLEDLEQAGDIVDLLEYDEDSAGGLMAKELVSVNENLNVQECLKEIAKQAEDVDEVYNVYVVNDDNILKGVLSLKSLISNPTNTKISTLYNNEVYSVRTEMQDEEVAQMMEKYDLVAIPVVDGIGRLKGRITIDDIVDVIREEAEKDLQMAAGLTGEIHAGTRPWAMARSRIPWLLIGMIGGLCGSSVIGSFQEIITKMPSIMAFIPLIAAMAGNMGIQSSSIVVQSLAMGNDHISLAKRLSKELLVAIFIALIFGILIFLYADFIKGDMTLAFSLSLSLIVVMLYASVFGTIVPIVLNSIKIDPAVATGPFITTTNDIVGLTIFFTVSAMVYNAML